MPAPLVLPDQYPLVLAAVTSSFFVNTFHQGLTSAHRKKAGIPYPNAYASAEQADKDVLARGFNCAQRAHANFTESHPSLVGAALIAGLHLPAVAAVLAGTWSVGRVVYAYGYTSNAGPKGRMGGFIIATLSDFALKGMAVYACYKMLVA